MRTVGFIPADETKKAVYDFNGLENNPDWCGLGMVETPEMYEDDKPEPKKKTAKKKAGDTK